MNGQQLFVVSLLLVNALALGAQSYAVKVVRRDREYAIDHDLNGYFSRYTETSLNGMYLGLGALVCMFLVFLISAIEGPQDRPITNWQLVRGLLFLGIDGFILARSFYVAFRYHQDVTG